MKMFLSDNNSGVHPVILDAICKCNKEHEYPYGDDTYSQEAISKFKEVFGTDVDVYFVGTGTAANVISLGSFLRPFEGVICPDSAHINVDECGAFEKFSGCKLLYVPNRNGKITTEDIGSFFSSLGDEHQTQPKIVSISQITELGTLYTLKEIREIAEFAHKNNLFLHVDGARISNAAAALNVSYKEMIVDTGVDLLSFGGTKNGMLMGEAIISMNPDISRHLKFMRKQGMHLISKMRYISCQFIPYLENDLWLESAKHANRMASLLASQVEKVPQIKLMNHAEGNMIFARIPKSWVQPLKEKYDFYLIDEKESLVRWVTSFDTTEEEISEFVNEIKKLSSK